MKKKAQYYHTVNPDVPSEKMTIARLKLGVNSDPVVSSSASDRNN